MGRLLRIGRSGEVELERPTPKWEKAYDDDDENIHK